MKFSTKIIEDIIDITFSNSFENFSLDKQNIKKEKIDIKRIGKNSLSILLNNNSYILDIYKNNMGYDVIVNQQSYFVEVKDELEKLLDNYVVKSKKSVEIGEISAPIPGLVSQIFVEVGDPVKKGQKLFILEAMKMENEISSTRKGLVSNINVKSGMSVEKDDLIMEIK